jgi:hypothetical protein
MVRDGRSRRKQSSFFLMRFPGRVLRLRGRGSARFLAYEREPAKVFYDG